MLQLFVQKRFAKFFWVTDEKGCVTLDSRIISDTRYVRVNLFSKKIIVV